MKIKWRCILHRLILPSAVAIITAVSLILLMIYVIPVVFPPQPLNETWYKNNQPITEYHEPMMFPIQFVILIALAGFVLVWIRDATKPCIIKENTTTDTIANGISTIIDLIAFVLCLLLFVFGLVALIGSMVVSPGYIIFAFIAFFSAYYIFPRTPPKTVDNDKT